MSDTLVIRIATPEDVHDVMNLALSACDENGFVDPNPEKLLAEIWPALHRDHGLVGLIGEPDGKPEGAILLRIGTMWYSDNQVLEEKAIFIHPDYRSAKGGRARKLCEFSKQVADGLGIPLIIGVLSNHRTEAKVKLYERQFGKPSGAFFLYGATTGQKSVMEH
jgi:GNAT superfamily N-acetyltransferase